MKQIFFPVQKDYWCLIIIDFDDRIVCNIDPRCPVSYGNSDAIQNIIKNYINNKLNLDNGTQWSTWVSSSVIGAIEQYINVSGNVVLIIR